MKFTDSMAAGIGVALNEADLLNVEYDQDRNIVEATFSLLTLPPDESPPPPDPRRRLILTKVGRIAAALREAHWDDLTAQPIAFEVHELSSIVKSFGGQPVYGWEFINSEDPSFENWRDRLSLDWRVPDGSLDNRMAIFQEGMRLDRHLDLWIWFSDLEVQGPDGDAIPLQDFIAGGRRWWDGLYAGDPRTRTRRKPPGRSAGS